MIKPMLATLVDAPFDDADWIFETKYDGLRVLCELSGSKVHVTSRTGQSQGFNFPDIVTALEKSMSEPALIDAEIVALDEKGRSSFRALQQRFHLRDVRDVERRMRQHPAYLYVFDILRLGDRDLTGLTLAERKKILKKALRWSDRIRIAKAAAGGGTQLFADACAAGGEGLIAKHKESPYVEGRSPWWVKIKCLARQELVIGGFTDPQRSRVGLGALLVGYYDDSGVLRYAGKVGTGFDRATLEDLSERLAKIETTSRSFADDRRLPSPRGVHWVKPELVAEIAFGEWTQNGLLRQPRYEGLRADKKPRDCRRESPMKESAMPHLEDYERKRHFTRTPEPGPKLGKRKRLGEKAIFVVQEHHATRLHYDFRLEADGVLKSWAVPKPPSLDPKEKRLAVAVEDHPVSYATFEGDIPKGEYGAGHVDIWDYGTYEGPESFAEAMNAGKIEFDLHGERLAGRFVLVRMKGRGRGKKENWLLIKSKDEHARPTARRAEPTKAALTRSKKKATPAHTAAKSSSKNAKLEFTNLDKIMFPKVGLTKGDLVDYYRRVARKLLPHLKNRPVTLERLPSGVTPKGPHFWQKDTPDHYPTWIRRVSLENEEGRIVDYALVNDVESLLYLVNQGTITFHPWFSRVSNLDRPDFVLFDLDPGKASLTDVMEVAKRLRIALEKTERCKPTVKTSGKSGLHVLVPWKGKGGYDEARDWARAVAERLVKTAPELATVDIRKAKRGNRVYVDVMQNARGHHAVPPYVVRAVPEASVSMPLSWSDLKPSLDPKDFTIENVLTHGRKKVVAKSGRKTKRAKRTKRAPSRRKTASRAAAR